MRPAYTIPDTKGLSDLLRDFRRTRQQVAIVLDEYGGTAHDPVTAVLKAAGTEGAKGE